MKLMKAVDLSIEKWELMVENGGDYDEDDFPMTIDVLKFNCGLCELFFGNGCVGCPLDDYEGNQGKEDLGDAVEKGGAFWGVLDITETCCYEFFKWHVADGMERERWEKYWAQKMLNRLYEVKLNLENL